MDYYSAMKTRPLPKETLIRNLRFLMDREGLSEAALAKRSGVSQKGINKILNGESAPTLDTVDKLSAAFGLNLWHLIMPNLPDDLISSPSIERLYSFYTSASPEGREYIDRVAKREADFGHPRANGNDK